MSGIRIKLPKNSYKVLESKGGKTKLAEDWDARRRQKQAGRQYWDKTKVKIDTSKG